MRAVRVGAVTIGQSPRDDLVPDLVRHFRSRVEIVQRGALDDLSADSVRAHSPVRGVTTLVSRMRDGTEVKLDRHFVLPRMQASIRALERQVQVILVLCTAPFDDLESKVPLLRPARILERLVDDMKVGRLGVLTPSSEQIPAQRTRWSDYAREQVVVAAASPYLDERGLADAVSGLIDAAVDLVVMDCIGYTGAMQARVRSMTCVPVLAALEELGKAAAAELD